MDEKILFDFWSALDQIVMRQISTYPELSAKEVENILNTYSQALTSRWRLKGPITLEQVTMVKIQKRIGEK